MRSGAANRIEEITLAFKAVARFLNLNPRCHTPFTLSARVPLSGYSDDYHGGRPGTPPE